MPFVPVVNEALVETRMTYDNQDVENTLWFGFTDAIDTTALTALANMVKGWWSSGYAGLVCDQVVLREVVATDQTTASSGQVSVSGAGDAGDIASVGMPGNVTLSVSFRTAFRGRSFRGRNYIVGIPTSQVTDISQIIPGYETSVIAIYTQLIADATAIGWTWDVVSRFSGVGGTPPRPIPRAAGVPTPITNVILVDRTLDGMRRRLPGRGN